MIPILFSPRATQFNTNGIGRLSDAISCTVTEERNGVYELELEYPIDGAHASELVNSAIIVAEPAQGATLQPFRVYKVSKGIGGRLAVSCRHISYQLSFIPFKPFSASSLAGALAAFKSMALEPCPFTLSADFNSNSSFAVPLPASIRSYLGGRQGSIIDVYRNGAEWEWNGYNCILHANRGADRGVVLRYGKNIIDLEQETNIENTITGIMPYWTSENSTVTLSAPVEASTAANFPFNRTVVKDFSQQWENAPTQAQLLAYTQSYIRANNIGIPAVSVDVSFVNLADTIEYKDIAPLETVKLCDIITVDFVRLGVSVKAKVIETEYDVLKGRYNSIKIGDARATLSSTIEDQAKQINQRPTVDETRTSIDRATGVLNAGLRGHVIINRNSEGWANEILFLDNENIAQAQNVLRINNAGIGFSSTGYQGPYYQSWTIDGHFALGGVNNAYGDFEILGADGKTLGEWDKDGLRLYGTAQEILLSITTGGFFLHGNNGKKLVELNHNGLYLYADDGQRVLAQMTNKGLGIYEGEIDLKWNGETGIYFKASETEGDSDTLQIGDFIVSTDYGRQIWESSDEMTGMSGEPDDYGGYFLWAGWRSDDDFAFAVEDQGGGGNDNVVIRGNLIVNDVDILDYIRNISIDDDEDDGDGGGGPDPGDDPGEDSGGTGPGYQGVNVNFDALVDYYSGGSGDSGGSSTPSGPASDPDLGGG